MAKFKVGDKVSVKREAAEAIDNPALARKRGRVTKVLPGGYYEIDGELGATGLELTDAELTLANSRVCSTNAVVAKALNAVGARNGHNAIRMTNAKFKPGDVVYCDYNQQVYAVLGSYDDKVSVKNLLNPEAGSQTVREVSLKEYPWKATDKKYPYYEKLAKKFANR